MWFIFPQLRAPNQSEMSRRFAFRSLDEASDFLHHEVLGPRLIQCTEAVLQHPDRTALEIFGAIDASKFHRCMSLFSRIRGADPVFERALHIFFDGERADPIWSEKSDHTKPKTWTKQGPISSGYMLASEHLGTCVEEWHQGEMIDVPFEEIGLIEEAALSQGVDLSSNDDKTDKK